MSKETNVNTNAEQNETPVVKKSWFNRFWSAVLGLLIGIAGMFGVNYKQVEDIRTEVKDVYSTVQRLQVAITEKDYGTAVSTSIEVANSLKDIVGEVKEDIQTVKENIEEYKADVVEIKTAIENKDWRTSHDEAVDLTKKILATVPENVELSGTPKAVYDTATKLIEDLDAGKYDKVIDTADKLIKFFENKKN